MRNKILLFGAVVFALLPVGFMGCASTPAPIEQHFYTITTNLVPVVTNFVEVVTVTNQADNTVVWSNVVHWRTNIETALTFTANTNATDLARSVGTVTNLFAPGFGELAALLFSGVVGLWGLLRSRKANQMTIGATVLAQSIETLLAVIQTTPQGSQLSDKLKAELVRNQVSAGVLAEVAHLVQTQVDNDAAKKAAQLILDSLPKPN